MSASPPPYTPENIDTKPRDAEEMMEKVKIDEGLVLLLSRIFIVFGGALPYIPQYLQIMDTQDASGFSTLVCLVVVTSNVLRIAYWVGHKFDEALLYQSILMTFLMLILVELCIRVERKQADRSGVQYQESYLFDFDLSKFWKWTTIWSYVEATLILLAVSCAYAYEFNEQEAFIEPVGFIALLVESTLGLPQFIKNYQNRSTVGMNIYMVLLWAIGDFTKGVFFFHTGQPLPFKLCASIQVIIDLSIIGQIFLYAK